MLDPLKARIGDLSKDLKEIKQQLLELTKSMAVNNHILQEHHKRSTQLEDRLSPIEDDYTFRRKLYVFVMGSSGLVAIISLAVAVMAMSRK